MPRQPAAPQPAPVAVEVPTPRDSRSVLTLRVTAYVLTSLASLVFLALVVWGYLGIQDLKQRMASSPLFGGTPSYSAPAVPGGDPNASDRFATICRDNPAAPECNGTSGN